MSNLILRCNRILPMDVALPEGITLSGDRQRVAAYDAGGEEIGSIVIRGRVLLKLMVQPDYRRRGVGTALCKYAMKLLRRLDNAQPVHAAVPADNWPALLILLRQGFKIQPEDGFKEGIDILRAVITPEQLAYVQENTAPEVHLGDLANIRYDEKGLVPAIAQDALTGEVLMLAYMNAESLRLTLEDGYATYFSRSRQELWRKGATSGHLQKVLTLSYDCDGDAILMQVIQTGPACHTGKKSCFHNPIVYGELPPSPMVLQEVYDTIADRAAHPKEGSYTNYLLNKGAEKIAKKVGEEASETIIAAIKGDTPGLAAEAGDLLYHLLVLLYNQGLTPADVWQELQHRR